MARTFEHSIASFLVGDGKSAYMAGYPSQRSASAESLIDSNAESLDKAVSACLSADWSLDRLTVIDRAILHAGTFELKEMPHLPARAVVSEYAAIADVCGSDVGFINAVLDRVARKARSVEMDRERANV